MGSCDGATHTAHAPSPPRRGLRPVPQAQFPSKEGRRGGSVRSWKACRLALASFLLFSQTPVYTLSSPRSAIVGKRTDLLLDFLHLRLCLRQRLA